MRNYEFQSWIFFCFLFHLRENTVSPLALSKIAEQSRLLKGVHGIVVGLSITLVPKVSYSRQWVIALLQQLRISQDVGVGERLLDGGATPRWRLWHWNGRRSDGSSWHGIDVVVAPLEHRNLWRHVSLNRLLCEPS